MNRTKEKIHHPIQSSKIIKMLINQEILLEISNGQSIKEGVMFYKFNESGNVFVLFCEKKRNSDYI